jgi:division protein CdvB (Snf7/Vps24/ESCRT-III family)
MYTLIQANKKLKISTLKLKSLLSNLDESSAESIFRPAMKDYMYVAGQLLLIEKALSDKSEHTQVELEVFEEGIALAITALTDIDEALNVAIDELHLTQ